MKKCILSLTISLCILISGGEIFGQGFLRTDGKKIVNEKGENVLLRGIGLGGWMLQEPYMLNYCMSGKVYQQNLLFLI